MSVRNTLEQRLKTAKPAEARDDARRWLARTEILLDWISRHPKLVEVNCEAAYLLSLYRGESVSAADVDYRGIRNRDKAAA